MRRYLGLSSALLLVATCVGCAAENESSIPFFPEWEDPAITAAPVVDAACTTFSHREVSRLYPTPAENRQASCDAVHGGPVNVDACRPGPLLPVRMPDGELLILEAQSGYNPGFLIHHFGKGVGGQAHAYTHTTYAPLPSNLRSWMPDFDVEDGQSVTLVEPIVVGNEVLFPTDAGIVHFNGRAFYIFPLKPGEHADRPFFAAAPPTDALGGYVASMYGDRHGEVVHRFDRNGAIVWTFAPSPEEQNVLGLREIAVDRDGTVAVIARSRQRDIAMLIVLEPSGTERFRVRIPWPESSVDVAFVEQRVTVLETTLGMHPWTTDASAMDEQLYTQVARYDIRTGHLQSIHTGPPAAVTAVPRDHVSVALSGGGLVYAFDAGARLDHPELRFTDDDGLSCQRVSIEDDGLVNPIDQIVSLPDGGVIASDGTDVWYVTAE